MGRLIEIGETVPVPFGRPRTPAGDAAAKMAIGESVLFDNDKDALRFKDCVRWYHGKRSVSVNKVPWIGWRVWRKK